MAQVTVSAFDSLHANPDWPARACRDKDPEVFFAERPHDQAFAKAICARCPIRSECLRLLGPVLDYGVVGGLTAIERREAARVLHG